MSPGVGMFTSPQGFWRVVHRLHVPACPYSQVFGGWTLLGGYVVLNREERRV